MIYPVALTQFALLAFGAMLMHIHSRGVTEVGPVAEFLKNYAIWLIMFPVLWSFYASAARTYEAGLVKSKIAIPLGIALIVAILAVYGYAIFLEK